MSTFSTPERFDINISIAKNIRLILHITKNAKKRVIFDCSAIQRLVTYI